jgi:hypothetical protein
MTIIIIEVPHQRPAFAWSAPDWQDALTRSEGRTTGVWVQTYDAAGLADIYGDDVPAEAAAIVAAHGSVVSVGMGEDEPDWYVPGSEPSTEDLARTWINRDVQIAYFYQTSEDVMADLANGRPDIYWPLRREAEQRGLIAKFLVGDRVTTFDFDTETDRDGAVAETDATGPAGHVWVEWDEQPAAWAEAADLTRVDS